MIRSVVIDDEILAREQVTSLLRKEPDMEVVAVCSNGLEGYHAICNHRPDLVFLDIQMPKVNGFEMLELLEETPEVIFSTAWDNYALRAFEVHAVDYLLKPYTASRFAEALQRARKRITSGEQVADAGTLYRSFREKQQGLHRLVVKKAGAIIIVPVEEIYYLEAMSDYVAVHTTSAKYLKHQTMAFFEQQLHRDTFIRVHRSYIVNLNYVQRMEPYSKDSWMVVMKNKTTVQASRTGMKRLKALLDNF
ncbi:MAG: LytTR family DNA-binding domain-containing protein [Bacteroidales bacterium]|nr:LytTR family DNA-binding domain-containing protein [Bacteroidales bacterium]